MNESSYSIDIIVAMSERTIKRLWVLIILLVLLLFGTNAAWIIYESQFEVVETTITQEVEQESERGNNSFVGGDYFGSTESEADNNG